MLCWISVEEGTRVCSFETENSAVCAAGWWGQMSAKIHFWFNAEKKKLDTFAVLESKFIVSYCQLLWLYLLLSSSHLFTLSKYLHRFWNTMWKNLVHYSTWELDLILLHVATLHWPFSTFVFLLVCLFCFCFKLN